MNDPQRPLFVDGSWVLWVLHNEDHPEGNGTSWRALTSEDLVTWRDAGTAVPKYTTPLGDVQTGSAVVDVDGSAGLGTGALLAIATQQADGVQRQSLFASTDGGRTFGPVPGNPVLDNPGTPDFRDPKVVRDEERGGWVMALAEGHRIGLHTSPDLRSWTSRSAFEPGGLGLLECPDLFRMPLDGDPDRAVWVLLAGADGSAQGRGTGTVYWTGGFDGSRFAPDEHPPRWLDHGPDLYATVTWPVGGEGRDDALGDRYAIGWMDSWSYARQRPTAPFAGGAQSIVRRLSLVTRDGVPTLASRPVATLDDLADEPLPLVAPGPLDGVRRVRRPGPSDTARLRVVLGAGSTAPLVRIRLSDRRGRWVTIDVRRPEGRLDLGRGGPGTEAFGPAWSRASSGPLAGGGRVDLDVVLDRGSVEVFAGDVVLTAATELDEVTDVELSTEGGVADVVAAELRPLRPVLLAA